MLAVVEEITLGEGSADEYNGSPTTSAYCSETRREDSSGRSPCFRLFDRRDPKTWQKVEFAKLIRTHKQILFGEGDGVGFQATAKAKEEAWREIARVLEEMGADSYKGKTWMRLRDHDWQYIRRHALNRFDNGTSKTGRLSELDQIVIDIVHPEKINNNTTQQINRQKTPTFEQSLQSLLNSEISGDSIAPTLAFKKEATLGSGFLDLSLFYNNLNEHMELESPLQSIEQNDEHPSRSVTDHSQRSADGKQIVTSESSLSTKSDVLRTALSSISKSPLTPTSSISTNSLMLSEEGSPSAKRTRRVDSSTLCTTSMLESRCDIQTLEHERIALEIKFLRSEEARKRELHLLDVERRKLINQFLHLRLLRECREKGDTDMLETLIKLY